MEEARHELDLAFASIEGLLVDNGGGATFDKYLSIIHRLSQLKEERDKKVHTGRG